MPAVVDASWTKAVDKVIDVPVERAWLIVKDFLGFPGSSCVEVECTAGENGVPGCVRKASWTNKDGGKTFVCEELLSMDDANHSFSYKRVDGDDSVMPGFKCFVQLTAEGEGKTRVQWPFCFTSTQPEKEMFVENYQKTFFMFVDILEKKGNE